MSDTESCTCVASRFATQVDPTDGFDFNIDDDEDDFAPLVAVNVSDGVALAGQIGDGGLVVRRTYVEEDEDSSTPTGADSGGGELGTDGNMQEGESLGAGLARDSRKTLLNFCKPRSLVRPMDILGPLFPLNAGIVTCASFIL